jgi:hypothetical protein
MQPLYTESKNQARKKPAWGRYQADLFMNISWFIFETSPPNRHKSKHQPLSGNTTNDIYCVNFNGPHDDVTQPQVWKHKTLQNFLNLDLRFWRQWPRRVLFSGLLRRVVWRQLSLPFASLLLGLFFHPEDGSNIFLLNAEIFLNSTAL